MSIIQALKDLLYNQFTIKDIGPVKYYLGLKIQRNKDGIFLGQQKFITDLLFAANMSHNSPLSVPIDPHIKLYDNYQSGDLLSNATSYRTFIGKLLYLTTSRPYIAFVVQLLIQFLHAPRVKHMEAVHRVLCYLKLTISHGLLFPSNNSLVLQGFSDSDWGARPLDRRSVGGYAFTLGPVIISCRSKKQALTSRSSTEAEYRALVDSSCEVIWLKQLLAELIVSHTGPIFLFCDNKSALDLATNTIYHALTKHIELDCHFIREKIHMGIVSILSIASKLNPADILTKGLGKVPNWNCCSKLGLSFAQKSLICRGELRILMMIR